jgi:peptidoglycan-associated lipoprotein
MSSRIHCKEQIILKLSEGEIMRKNPTRLLFLLSVLATVVTLGACHKEKVTAAPPPAPPPAAAPSPAPVVSLTAEPATVEKGQSVTLSWASQNATEVAIQPGVGSVQATGSTTVTPQDSTTYVATANGPGGSTTASARVTVTTPPPPPPPAPARAQVSESELFSANIKDAYFDYDKSDVRADAQQALTADADVLKANADIVFTIEGHCDERGSEEYNLGLGDRRATAAKNFLVNLGISPNRILTISYGKDRPFCTESTVECWQSNRRAHFVFGRPVGR